MTESEWLVCTNPHAMYGSLTSNLKWIADKANWILSENKCDLLRCVVGNPFQPIGFTKNKCKRCNGLGYEDVSKEPCSTAIMDCLRCDGTGSIGILLDSALLTWRDGTIPRLAQAIMEASKCKRCRGKGREIDRLTHLHTATHCPACNGTGHATLDRDLMLVLADAVEEANGPAEIVEHLREHEKECECCTGIGSHCHCGIGITGFFKKCGPCNGTGKRPRLHVANCHAVAMWLGEKP